MIQAASPGARRLVGLRLYRIRQFVDPVERDDRSITLEIVRFDYHEAVIANYLILAWCFTDEVPRPPHASDDGICRVHDARDDAA